MRRRYFVECGEEGLRILALLDEGKTVRESSDFSAAMNEVIGEGGRQPLALRLLRVHQPTQPTLRLRVRPLGLREVSQSMPSRHRPRPDDDPGRGDRQAGAPRTRAADLPS